jgi:hypothetical protein
MAMPRNLLVHLAQLPDLLVAVVLVTAMAAAGLALAAIGTT